MASGLYPGSNEGIDFTAEVDGTSVNASVGIIHASELLSFHVDVPGSVRAMPLLVVGQLFITASGMPVHSV